MEKKKHLVLVWPVAADPISEMNQSELKAMKTREM